MSSQCIFKDDKGDQCPEMIETGLFCTKHGGEAGKPYTADETPAKSTGGGGGSGGLSIMGRTGVVYQRED